MAPPKDGDRRPVDYESKFLNARNNFHCSLIDDKFAEKNGRPIKPKEAAFFRGTLEQKNPETIADELGRSYEAVRQDLKNFYPLAARTFGKVWDGCEMGWYLIPLWAMEQGYWKFSSLEVVLTLISKPSDFPTDNLILFMSQKLEERIRESSERRLDQERTDRLNKYIQQGDEHDKQNRYEEALNDYEWVLKQEPYHYFPVLVKIVITLEKKGAHADAYKLGMFALRYIQFQKHRSILYNIIAGAHHDVALQQCSETILNQAMGYYDLSLKCSHDELTIYPAWNALELLIDYGLQSQKVLYFNQAIVKSEELGKIKKKLQNLYPNFNEEWDKIRKNSGSKTLNKVGASLGEDSSFFTQLSWLEQKLEKLFQ